MNRSTSVFAASLVALSSLTFGSSSQASTLTSVAPAVVSTSAFEAINALAARTLDPSLQSANAAGSGITDATVTPPSTVPEPESIALLGLGLAAMFVAKRRTARKNG